MKPDPIIERERQYWEARSEFEWLSEASIAEVIRSIPIRGDVLELCSGSGMFTKRMPASWSSYTCLDLSQSLLDTLKEELPGITTVRGDAQRPELPNEAFDLVLILAGLHHLSAPEMAISSAYRMLKKGGDFICFEPNEDCWYRRPILPIRNLLGIYTEDERFLKPADILGTMREAGLRNLDVTFLTPVYNPARVRTPIRRLLAGLMQVASGLSTSPSWQSFFIAKGRK